MPLVLILTPLLVGLFGFDLKDVIQPWALLLSRPRVRPGGGTPC